MLDIWGDHHMDTAAAEAEVGIREFIGIALHRQRYEQRGQDGISDLCYG